MGLFFFSSQNRKRSIFFLMKENKALSFGSSEWKKSLNSIFILLVKPKGQASTGGSSFLSVVGSNGVYGRHGLS